MNYNYNFVLGAISGAPGVVSSDARISLPALPIREVVEIPIALRRRCTSLAETLKTITTDTPPRLQAAARDSAVEAAQDVQRLTDPTRCQAFDAASHTCIVLLLQELFGVCHAIWPDQALEDAYRYAFGHLIG